VHPGLEKIMIFNKKIEKKSDFFYLNQIFFNLNRIFFDFLNFFAFSVLLCIVVALNNLNFIVSCTLHRIKVLNQ